MATKKTIYHTFQDSPEAWLQAAVDAKEITEAEREAIEKFLDAPTKAEAAKQMDVIRASMLNRPEFDLTQEERKELGDLADSLDTHRRQLNDDILRMSTRRQNLEAKGNNISQEEIEELGMIEAQLKSRQAELEQENRLYSTYLLIGALTTTEQAQQQANRWYEDVGREQGKNLLTAFSEYAQVAVHAIIPGHKEQVQDHLQKAEAASGRYQASVARGFSNQLRRMEPSRRERKADNKLTKQANKQIKKVQRAARKVRAKEAKLIREARAIALNEYKFRERFNHIPGWQQGAPVDKTFLEIKTYDQAQAFMMSRNPEAAEKLHDEVREAREKLVGAKHRLNEVMEPMLSKLDARQHALNEFMQDYQQAIHDGYVGQQRADEIFERLGEATKYALFTPEFAAKLKEAGIQFDPKYQTMGAQAPQQAEPARRPSANPVQEAYQQASEAAAKQPAHAPRAQNDIPRVTPSAITRWDDYIAQTEQQNQPKCLCYRDKTGPHAIALDADPKKRSEQIERFKQDHGGDKARFSVKNEREALRYLEIEGLKFRGARGMDKEHAQAWREFVDTEFKTHKYPATIEPAVQLAEMARQGANEIELLQKVGSLMHLYVGQDIGEILDIAGNTLDVKVLQDMKESIVQHANDHTQSTGRTWETFKATELYEGLQDLIIETQEGQVQGHDLEEPEEEQAFDPTDNLG